MRNTQTQTNYRIHLQTTGFPAVRSSLAVFEGVESRWLKLLAAMKLRLNHHKKAARRLPLGKFTAYIL